MLRQREREKEREEEKDRERERASELAEEDFSSEKPKVLCSLKDTGLGFGSFGLLEVQVVPVAPGSLTRKPPAWVVPPQDGLEPPGPAGTPLPVCGGCSLVAQVWASCSGSKTKQFGFWWPKVQNIDERIQIQR